MRARAATRRGGGGGTGGLGTWKSGDLRGDVPGAGRECTPRHRSGPGCGGRGRGIGAAMGGPSASPGARRVEFVVTGGARRAQGDHRSHIGNAPVRDQRGPGVIDACAVAGGANSRFATDARECSDGLPSERLDTACSLDSVVQVSGPLRDSPACPGLWRDATLVHWSRTE